MQQHLQTIQQQQNSTKMSNLMNSGSNMLSGAQGGVKNMRTLQPPSGGSNTQAKIVNAQQQLVTKSSKGGLSGKLRHG